MKRHPFFSALFIVAGLSWPAAAAPTDENPTAALAVSEHPDSKAAVELASTFYDQAQRSIAQFAKMRADGTLARVGITNVGRAHLQLVRLERQVKRLQTLGEPAGYDFELRLRSLRTELNLVIDDAEKVPAIDQQLKQAYAALRQQVKREAAAIPKAERLAKGGKWEAAQDILHNAQDDWEPLAGWFSGRTRTAAVLPFIEPLRIVDQKVFQLREERAKAALQAARNAQLPDFDQLVAELQMAASALASNPTATYGDTARSGPEVVRAAGERWRQAQLATVHCYGFDWARGLNTRGSGDEELNALVAGQKKFADEMLSGIATVIAADASRATGDEARQLYQQYLTVLAPLVSATGRNDADGTLASAVADPLAELASRAPGLTEEIAAYRAATDDLLRWRRRTARAYAAARASEYPALAEQYLAAAQATEQRPGLVAQDATNTTEAELRASVVEIFPPLVEQVQGKRVTCRDIVGLDASDKLAVGRYADRQYSRIVRSDVEPAIAALAADLLASESLPPLSLAATVALESARSGDLESAGGSVTGIALEALATRYQTLPAAGRQLLALGPVPAEPATTAPLKQLLVRFDITTNWVQHPMFFVEVSAD